VTHSRSGTRNWLLCWQDGTAPDRLYARGDQRQPRHGMGPVTWSVLTNRVSTTLQIIIRSSHLDIATGSEMSVDWGSTGASVCAVQSDRRGNY
jgi:hypothetical protein